MFNLNENHHLRKCYFDREQVPTQSVMKDKMTPALANVYFKLMTPKLKVLAGLEPPMKGGGSDWFVPPEELLKGRAVMKPTKKQYLMKLGFNGIDFFGEKLVQDHLKGLELEKAQAILESDLNWKKTIEKTCREQWEETSAEAAKENTVKIQQAFYEFQTMYTTSITKIENILFDAAIKEIERVRNDTHMKMTKHYNTLLKKQAEMLYDRYTEKLMKEKERQKQEFIMNVEELRTEMGDKLRDIHYEKHVAVEKLRHFLQCRNMACQVYVALKEREECNKEIEKSRHIQAKKIKKLKDVIALKDFEIKLEKEKESQRKEVNKIWQKKICHVVKKFQLFVAYCLKLLPDHAQFFLNIEKLMLLQLDNTLEESTAPSLFEDEEEKFHSPVPRPHPFFLVCDKGYKPQVDQNLVPPHCTSSASEMPVIVVNKRFIYAACDNFEKFTDKIQEFIRGRRGDEKDFLDDHNYDFDYPVKITSSKQLLELKLESSLMQVLQKEFANVKEVAFECCVCKTPYCFCSSLDADSWSDKKVLVSKMTSNFNIIDPGKIITERDQELHHEREPKWESYMKFVESKKCKCAKTAKNHLKEHLPPYMRNMSKFEAPKLPNYEPCSLKTLKMLVKKAKGIQTPPPAPSRAPSKTKDVSTQYNDEEFDFLCTCFSDNEIEVIYKKIFGVETDDTKSREFQVVDASLSQDHLEKNVTDFAMDAAHTLRNILARAPTLEEIFKKEDCEFK